jgi:hypothetical protein
MEKLHKFFMTAIVVGLVSYSLTTVIPTHLARALVTDNQIADNAITSPKIKDGQVKTLDLANGTMTKDKISPFALKLVTVERHAEFTTMHPFHFLHGEVKCNTGETATGGGYYNADPHIGTVTFMNRPIQDTSGWHVGIYSPDGGLHQFTAYVVCAHLELSP